MGDVTMTQPEQPVNTRNLRLSRTPADMAKAVLVLLIPVVVLVTVYVTFFGGNNVIAIDPSGSYDAARAAGQFTVLQPDGLSNKWKPVSSAYEGGVLRVGYITPSGAGIQLIESKQDLTDSELGATSAIATAVNAGGLTWGQLGVSGKTDKALVNTQNSRTVIIKGRTDYGELKDLAASLR
jgi:Protein of unknown function (DUF4245)